MWEELVLAIIGDQFADCEIENAEGAKNSDGRKNGPRYAGVPSASDRMRTLYLYGTG